MRANITSFGLSRSAAVPGENPLTFSSCIPPFAAVTLTLEDGAFSTAWRRAMATGFLSLFYLTFLPVVFFSRQPMLASEAGNRVDPSSA